MIALAHWRNSRCHQCGGDLEETTSPDNDGSPGAGAFIHIDPLRCHRCAAYAKAEEQYRKEPYPHSLLHRVEYRPPRHQA